MMEFNQWNLSKVFMLKTSFDLHALQKEPSVDLKRSQRVCKCSDKVFHSALSLHSFQLTKQKQVVPKDHILNLL